MKFSESNCSLKGLKRRIILPVDFPAWEKEGGDLFYESGIAEGQTASNVLRRIPGPHSLVKRAFEKKTMVICSKNIHLQVPPDNID
jgi:hypothetical protein